MPNTFSQIIEKNLKKRKKKEVIFRRLGAASIVFSLAFLAILFSIIILRGYSAFISSRIAIEVNLTKENLTVLAGKELPATENEVLDQINYRDLIINSLAQNLGFITPDSYNPREVMQLISKSAYYQIEEKIRANPKLLNQKVKFWVAASSKADMYLKHQEHSSLSEEQIILIKKMKAQNLTKKEFNWAFFKNADSREAEMAGIAASVVGTFFTAIIFLSLAFPIGVMCAFYLEEFAPKNTLTDIVEVSINNLAAIPSIIYGLLGLTVYLQFFHVPRSSSLAGGLTLFLLVLPVITIATRNTIRSIPNSIRDGAMAVGASKMQIVLHHILPLSIPGVMTGTILAVSRAIGETAPLLMIGMVAFIADKSTNFMEPSTVLPVQIYLWSDSPEFGFAEKTAAAIIVLLGLLVIFNSLAIYLRKKYEVKW